MRRRINRCREVLTLQGEKGQAIVIIAFALVALVLFAGLALDAATIYAGQSRLKRAIDAAALAAVVELPNEDAAAARTRQFMLGNGFDTSDASALPRFETGRLPSTEYIQWAVTATYRVPLNFLPVINFDYAEVTEVAVAEYRSMVDMYTSQTGGRGIVGPVFLHNWGRNANPLHGDAYTPQCWTCESGCICSGGVGVPGQDCCPVASGSNRDHSELYNEFNQGYPFRIYVPPGYAYDEVRIEILDPDGYNQVIDGDVTITHWEDGSPEVIDENDIDCDPYGGGSHDNDQREVCLLDTGDELNPYWFLRMDENWSFVAQPWPYDETKNTETEYRLFYHKQLPDQSIVKQYLYETYVGGANDSSTDLQWIAPWGNEGNVDVNCDDGCDVPNIVLSDDGSFSLYVEVDGVSGWSMNGFDLWAGPPPPITETIPSNVNDRNVYLLQNQFSHDPGGVVTYGCGYLPLHLNASDLVEMTFAFIPPEAAAIGMNLFHFDNDHGSLGQQVDYYLEGVSDWHYQGTLSLNGTWSTSEDGLYQPPGSRDHDSVMIPDEFYGGYLMAEYEGRFRDTSTWHLEYEGVVGDVFVRLIQ